MKGKRWQNKVASFGMELLGCWCDDLLELHHEAITAELDRHI